MKRTFVLFILVILISSCEFKFEREKVTLYCPDCAAAGMKINLWATPDEFTVKSLANHNDICEVIETESFGDQQFYKVECDGPSGWLSEDLIRK